MAPTKVGEEKKVVPNPCKVCGKPMPKGAKVHDPAFCNP